MTTQQDLILGLDFGGTKLAAGLYDPQDGSLIQKTQTYTRASLGAAVVVSDMLQLVEGLLSGIQVRRVGVSFGGHVHKGQILRSLHVPGWTAYPLEAQLREALNGVDEVCIANDANAAALGEWRFGAGQGTASMLFITVSTGIGGAIVLDGKLWPGATGMAGEIGHMQIVADGPECSCGQTGCLEVLAAGPAISRRAEALGVTPISPDGSHQQATLTAHAVAQLANQGDPLAQRALLECAHYFGIGVANAVTLLDIERVVVGGGVSRAGALWWDTVCSVVHGRVLPRQQAVEIVNSALGEYEGVWGAVALVID